MLMSGIRPQVLPSLSVLQIILSPITANNKQNTRPHPHWIFLFVCFPYHNGVKCIIYNTTAYLSFLSSTRLHTTSLFYATYIYPHKSYLFQIVPLYCYSPHRLAQLRGHGTAVLHAPWGRRAQASRRAPSCPKHPSITVFLVNLTAVMTLHDLSVVRSLWPPLGRWCNIDQPFHMYTTSRRRISFKHLAPWGPILMPGPTGHYVITGTTPCIRTLYG